MEIALKSSSTSGRRNAYNFGVVNPTEEEKPKSKPIACKKYRKNVGVADFTTYKTNPKILHIMRPRKMVFDKKSLLLLSLIPILIYLWSSL